ncbi:hypothetical protein ACHQM5_010206 [Ranunculus cassubicifolius]
MYTSSRNNRQNLQEDKLRMIKSPEKSASFHARNPAIQPILRRPKTDPDLLHGRKLTGLSPEMTPKPSKLLLKVTIERSLGAIHVVISPESTVEDLITAAVRQYVKEGRRPFLQKTDPPRFDLHYSTFSLDSLDRQEKLINLGSRSFFMCHGKDSVTKTVSASSCSNEAELASKIGFPWIRIKEFFI